MPAAARIPAMLRSRACADQQYRGEGGCRRRPGRRTQGLGERACRTETLADEVRADPRRDPPGHLRVEPLELALAERPGPMTQRFPGRDRLETDGPEHRMRDPAARPFCDAGSQRV